MHAREAGGGVHGSLSLAHVTSKHDLLLLVKQLGMFNG